MLEEVTQGSRKGTTRLRVTFVRSARRLLRRTVSSGVRRRNCIFSLKPLPGRARRNRLSLRKNPLCTLPSGLTLILSMPQEEISPSATPSPAVTLFTYRFDPGPRPTSFVVSILIHSVAVAIIWFGIAYKPPIAKVDTQHYTARRLDLRTPDQQRRDDRAGIAYPGSHATASKPASGGKPSRLRQPVLRQMAQAKPGPQTLIQPDLLAQVTLNEEIPVPQIVIWTPSKTPVKNIVPPLPQKPTAADVKPTFDAPNQEVNLSDVNIASSNHPSPSNMVAASTTSPVAVHLPEQVQLPPVSATQNSAQPTPAAILSLSDLRTKDGTAMLPPVNESAAANVQGALAPGRVQDSSPQGSGDPAAKLGQTGAGPASAAKSNASAPGPAVAAAKPETSAPAQGADLPSESSGKPTLTQIALPKDGHFSAVVVGDALEDRISRYRGRVERQDCLYRLSARGAGQELDLAVLASARR